MGRSVSSSSGSAEVLEALESSGVPGYTEFPKLIGRGRHTRHFDNPIWPGAVGAIFTVVHPQLAEGLVQSFTTLDQVLDARTRGLHGIHLFALPCQQLI